MQNKKTIITIVLMGWIYLSGGAALRAQHEHQPTATPPGGATPVSEEMEHIFCPTMKTGQMCSHGTAATLGLEDTAAEAWITLARKYNRAVDAATLQLFKDAESVLSAEQQAQLKAWFAVGLNPQINDLLYTKGLGTKKDPAAAPAADMDEK